MTSALEARSRRRVVLLLMVVALSPRVAHLRAVLDTGLTRYHVTFLESDMYMFDQWAQHILATGDLLGRETYHPLYRWQLLAASEAQWREWYGAAPVFYKAPFYPYALALVRWLFGDPWLPMCLLQVLASMLGAALLYAVTERLFGSAPAVGAALLYAVYAPAIHYDAVLLRGPWIVLTALLVTWQLGRVLDAPAARRAAVLGGVTALALVVNEGFATLPPLVLLVLAARVRGARRLAAAAGAFLGGLGVALLPLLARNLAVGVAPFKLAVTGSIVYAVFNAAGTSPFFFELRPAVFGPVMEQAGGGLFATMLACLRSHEGPGALAWFYAQKALGLIVPFESPDNANFYFAAWRDPLLGLLPGYAVLLPAAAVGAALARRRVLDLLVLAPAGASLAAAILVAMPLSRYRATLAVLLMPAAGLALARAAEWARARRFGPLAVAWAGAFVVAWAAARVEDRVVFARSPAGARRYRLSEFWQEAEHQAARGRPVAAARTLIELPRLNPEPLARVRALSRAAIVLAPHDAASARALLHTARGLAAHDAALLLTVGDACQEALGAADAGAAAAAWREALALDPPAPLAAALRKRLASLEPAAGVQ